MVRPAFSIFATYFSGAVTHFAEDFATIFDSMKKTRIPG